MNIQDAVTYAQQNFTFINVTYVKLDDIMVLHGFCSTDPWVYGPSVDFPASVPYPPFVEIPDYPAPFHPTVEGQKAIYQEIRKYIITNI